MELEHLVSTCSIQELEFNSSRNTFVNFRCQPYTLINVIATAHGCDQLQPNNVFRGVYVVGASRSATISFHLALTRQFKDAARHETMISC